MNDRYQRMLWERLIEVYGGLARHGSVPPADRHRTEGFAAAGLALGLVSAAELCSLLQRAHDEALGESFLARQGCEPGDCIDTAGSQLSLPCRMVREPVFPSTAE
jgi:hypothetical protein